MYISIINLVNLYFFISLLVTEQVTEKKIRVWKTVKSSLEESKVKEIAKKGKFEGNKIISFPYSFV